MTLTVKYDFDFEEKILIVSSEKEKKKFFMLGSFYYPYVKKMLVDFVESTEDLNHLIIKDLSEDLYERFIYALVVCEDVMYKGDKDAD